jgi:hypothetical protein
MSRRAEPDRAQLPHETTPGKDAGSVAGATTAAAPAAASTPRAIAAWGAIAVGSLLAVTGLSALLGSPIEQVLTSAATLVGLLLAAVGLALLFAHPEGVVVAWVEALGRFPLWPRWPIRVVLLLLLASLLVDRANNPGGPPMRTDVGEDTTYRQVTDGVYESVEPAEYRRLAGYQVAIAQLFASVLALGAAAIISPAPTTARRRPPPGDSATSSSG